MAQAAFAQETPKVEIAALYQATPEFFGPTCHGAGSSISFNVNDWFSAVGDIGGCKGRGTTGFFILGFGPTSSTTQTQFTYLVGPRVSYRRTFTPYAQVLFGGIRATTDNPNSPIRGNSSAMTVGFGIDLRLTQRFRLRLIQPEYLRTRFGGTSHEDLRLQTGVVFAFGTQ